VLSTQAIYSDWGNSFYLHDAYFVAYSTFRTEGFIIWFILVADSNDFQIHKH